MFRVQFTFWLGLSLLLVSCGKPSERPALPSQSKPSSFENFLLGRRLTHQDAKNILKKLNQAGEWDALERWFDSLSVPQFQKHIDFFNHWIFEEAQTSKGFLSILSKWIDKKQFSFWNEILADISARELNPQDRLFDLIENLIPAFEPSVVSHLTSVVTKMKEASQNLESPEQIFEDLERLLTDSEKNEKLELAFRSFIGSRAWNGLRNSGWEQIVPYIPEHLGAIEEMLQLAHLLNRPSDKIAEALQRGLKNNPDLFQALGLKWNPFFVSILSERVVEVLLAPEDGVLLDKNFWLSLPRATLESGPTESFTRLYSLVFSGISQISDPLKNEPQMDSGTYRFPLQVSALYLTHLLEEWVRQKKSALSALSPEGFSTQIWEQKLELFDWTWELSSSQVKADLKALGLETVLLKLESLLTQPDSGITRYQFSEAPRNFTLKAVFASGLALSHQIRPLSDINPLLWVVAQSLADLDFLKTSPSLLNQLQGALAELSPEQWERVYRFLFEELKLGELEPEDKMLIVSVFQSDPEIAEWVALVLERLSAVPSLESKGFLSAYLKILQSLNQEEQSSLGMFLSGISELEILGSDENGIPHYPGFRKWLVNPEAMQKLLGGFAKCPPEVLDYLVMNTKMDENFGLYRLFIPLLKKLRVVDSSALEISRNESDWIYRFVQEGGLQELRRLEIQTSPWNDLSRLVQTGDFSKGMWLLSFIQNERMKEVALVFRKWGISGELEAVLESLSRFLKESKK